MNKTILSWLLPLWLLALLPTAASAQTTKLSIEDDFKSIKAGEEKELVIDLTNPNEQITLVQFDLRLPSGLSLKMEDGDYVVDIAGRTTWKKHSLNANAQADGSIRFLLASSSNAALTGTSGAIITMTVMAGSSFNGGDVNLENILMVTPAETEIKQDTYIYSIPTPTPPDPPVENVFLSIPDGFNIMGGEEKEMAIHLANPNNQITLVQFDLRLPSGVTLKMEDGDYACNITGRTTLKKHSLNANAQADGSIRFLLASSSNAALTGTSGAIITMTLVASSSFTSGTLTLENILMVTPEEKEARQATYSKELGGKSPVDAYLTNPVPFNITSGGEQKLIIGMTNPSVEITLVQFDLRLPKGLSLKTENGEYVFDMGERTNWRKHSLDINQLADGSIRFLLSSSSNATISGTEGEILEVTIVADKNFSGEAIVLSNILLVTPDEKEIKPEDLVISLWNQPATLSVEYFGIVNGEAKMFIDMTNPVDEVTLVQFDLRLPEGVSLKTDANGYVYDIVGRTTWKKHSLDVNATDGIYRFLFSSASNAVFSGSEGAIIELSLLVDNDFKEGSAINLENILLVTPQEKEMKPADVVYHVVRAAGDVNFDGVVNVADIASIISILAGKNLK